jgi:hypothetical protein
MAALMLLFLIWDFYRCVNGCLCLQKRLILNSGTLHHAPNIGFQTTTKLTRLRDVKRTRNIFIQNDSDGLVGVLRIDVVHVLNDKK